jgi:hypothetical protein
VARARARLESGLATLREHGANVRWEIDIAETYWLGTLLYLGEWRELARLAPSLLRDALERGDVVAQLGLRTGRTALAYLLAGHVDEARTQLADAERSLATGFYLPHVLAIQAACEIDLYAGKAPNARARLAEAWPDIERIGVLRVQQLRVELSILRARVALADTTRAADDRSRVARTMADAVIEEAAPWAVGLGLLVRAAAVAMRGDRAGALAQLAAAEEQLAATGMIAWLQLARLRRAVVEGGAAGIARAEAARDILRDLGAADPDAVAASLVPWPA